MKHTARQLAAPNGHHAKIDLLAVTVKLNILLQPNAT